MEIKDAQCHLCGSKNARPVTTEGEWNVLQCKDCTFVFIEPLPDEKFLHRHYQSYLPADGKRIGQWRIMMHDVFTRSLDIIEKQYSLYPPGDLLDVGSGYGFFLEEAASRGWRAQGIEPCEHARAYSVSKGLNVAGGNLFDRSFKDSMFDVVTLFYVLEHVLQPLRYLEEVYRILRPGGILLVRVPHTTPIAKALKTLRIPNRLYDAPSHLSDFSPRTLAMALKKTGFDNIATFPGGATCPSRLSERVISQGSGLLADALYVLSGRRFLLPGVSKTTIARKK